jgi:hypothetical protein
MALENLEHCNVFVCAFVQSKKMCHVIRIRSLSALLQSDNCSLTRLHLWEIGFGDDGAAALADGLKASKTLKMLLFSESAGLTSIGWSSFSKLLCDTSSVNSTYLSNHTLETIGNWCNRGTPDGVTQLLTLNQLQINPLQ